MREDDQIRAAAFEHIRSLIDTRGHLASVDLASGFVFQGERIPLVNPQRGIFKPRQMQYLLSIRTVFPRSGRKIWYDDQRRVHGQIYDGEETVEYAFMGNNPDAADNRWLREAMEMQKTLIYFLGVSPGNYQAFIPTFVTGWDARSLRANISFGIPGEDEMPDSAAERRYALREVKQRLHQASFRDAVITAYNGRCALSNLPEPMLLDAAHIIGDKDREFGQPIVPNGIPLSKIHHAAFDSHLIGIDPDFRIHVSKRLLDLKDGPMLEAMKQLHHRQIHLPSRKGDYPDRSRLERRFQEFRQGM